MTCCGSELGLYPYCLSKLIYFLKTILMLIFHFSCHFDVSFSLGFCSYCSVYPIKRVNSISPRSKSTLDEFQNKKWLNY